MPELPEVETVVQTLKNEILNTSIVDVKINFPKIIKNIDLDSFRNQLIGEEFLDVKRRGKYILIITTNYCILNHLRMEGKYYIREEERNFDMFHNLVAFYLTDGRILHFNDTRRFGTFHLYKKEEMYKDTFLKNVGIEPFDEELTGTYLADKWKNRRIPIKVALLEQGVVCGIGNIYACEILYDAKINPFKPINKLTASELDSIIASTRKILLKAIKAGGSTVTSFTNAHGISGKFQNELKVYGKLKENCEQCGNKIIRVKLRGRGTYFCPFEQNVSKKEIESHTN